MRKRPATDGVPGLVATRGKTVWQLDEIFACLPPVFSTKRDQSPFLYSHMHLFVFLKAFLAANLRSTSSIRPACVDRDPTMCNLTHDILMSYCIIKKLCRLWNIYWDI
jgi:hypothetical protein